MIRTVEACVIDKNNWTEITNKNNHKSFLQCFFNRIKFYIEFTNA